MTGFDLTLKDRACRQAVQTRHTCHADQDMNEHDLLSYICWLRSASGCPGNCIWTWACNAVPLCHLVPTSYVTSSKGLKPQQQQQQQHSQCTQSHSAAHWQDLFNGSWESRVLRRRPACDSKLASPPVGTCAPPLPFSKHDLVGEVSSDASHPHAMSHLA
jgi:hypothetical protein